MALVTIRFVRKMDSILPDYAAKYKNKKNDSSIASQIKNCILSDARTYGAVKDTPSGVLDYYFHHDGFMFVEPVQYNNGHLVGQWSYKNYTPKKKVPAGKGYLIDKGMIVTYSKRKADNYMKHHASDIDSQLGL